MSKKQIPVEALKTSKDNYAVETKYSQDAINKNLIKFTVTKGKSFEISLDELIELLAKGVNKEKLAPLFVNTEQVDMVYVKRQLHGKAGKTIEAGGDITLEYVHPYPVEFAILEEAYQIAQIDMNVPKTTITMEYLAEVKEKIKPKAEEFLKASYRSFELPLDKKT
jgi:hypothetical protein